MYGLLGFSSIEEELIFIALLLVILTILLFCDYRQKQLEKELRCLKEAYDANAADEKDMPHKDGSNTNEV